ncbi:mttA/Hcf106 family protein [Frigoribacterium sp. PhB107]|uniref:twin-arginine translocase TatA/TatE family subunit n=1 Tax=Frigoribacterium sp. PhB107 TaxID=2485172 RepID=UPI000F934C5E|nr:twin-arginine translocase TatA/TatE family subunit [Frigoribacterium sp. PhB107]ROP77639.1 mttA/Hcf106 family protein [Frigoribacterium sp. PhB107]
MIGVTADKLLLIAVLVAFLFGPERLPHLAERFGSAIRTFRGHLTSTEQRMRDELGGDIDVNDWKKLDPRQYDPRTIIRDALTADTAAVPTTAITDQEAMAVPDDFSDDADQGAAGFPEQDSSADSETMPVFRRRSDGHLELVSAPSAPSATEGVGTDVATSVAS